LKQVDIFTDGACSGNPGPGGWGTILRYRGIEKELSGFEADTTNNRMELRAVLEALGRLKGPCRLTIYSDSQYVCNGMTKWIVGWKQNGWNNSAMEPVKNRDMWEALDETIKPHQVDWVWVKGHAGHPENERCDQLANKALRDKRGVSDNGSGIASAA
jgi:ribonuclease HI